MTKLSENEMLIKCIQSLLILAAPIYQRIHAYFWQNIPADSLVTIVMPKMLKR